MYISPLYKRNIFLRYLRLGWVVEGGLATSGQVEESQTRAEYANITILQPSPFIPTSISIWKAFWYWKSFYGKRTPRWTNAWEKNVDITFTSSHPFSQLPIFLVLFSFPQFPLPIWPFSVVAQCCPSQLLPVLPTGPISVVARSSFKLSNSAASFPGLRFQPPALFWVGFSLN